MTAAIFCSVLCCAICAISCARTAAHIRLLNEELASTLADTDRRLRAGGRATAAKRRAAAEQRRAERLAQLRLEVESGAVR